MIGDLIEEIFESVLDFFADKTGRGWRRLPRWGKVLAIIVLIAGIVGVVMLCQALFAWITLLVDPTPVKAL